jgi:site-specific DNA-methyltransferase (adenine-specific)
MNQLYYFGAADAAKLPLDNKSVKLVCGSPPYLDRRTYGTTGMRRKIHEWVDWMLQVTIEGLRVSTGPVMWVAAGCVKQRRYHPAVEGLIWEGFKAGLQVEHPLIWSKNAAPNRKDWWCTQTEYVVAFIPPEWDRYFDWKAIAKPQKFMSGGGFRQRAVDGSRKVKAAEPRNELARPYNIVRATVGGGHMGHDLAHQNEAPFPESLVRQIIPALTRPGDIVLDPFSGSGTTVDVAVQLGRRGIGFDTRESQALIGQERLKERTQQKLQEAA